MRKKYALVLSGGGFKGAFQLGAIRHLRNNWKAITGQSSPMKFDIIAGVSVGSLNGAMIATGQYHMLEKLWDDVFTNGGGVEIYNSDFIDSRGNINLDLDLLKKKFLPEIKLSPTLVFNYLFNKSKFQIQLLKLLKTSVGKRLSAFQALANNIPLKEKLFAHIQRNKIPDDVHFCCGFVSLQDGLYHACSHHDFDSDADLVNAILASSAMPLIWQPVSSINYRGKTIYHNVDGGVRNNSPLGDAINLINKDPIHNYHLFIINCSSGITPPAYQPWNIANIAFRSLADIAMEEIFNNDLKTFFDINDMVQQAAEKNLILFKNNRTGNREALQYFESTLIAPEQHIIGTTLDSNKAMLEQRIKHGMDRAALAFQKY